MAVLCTVGCTEFAAVGPSEGSTSAVDSSSGTRAGSSSGDVGTSTGDVVPASSSSSTSDADPDTTSGCVSSDCDPPDPDPRCDDGVHNAEETDVDCGGSECEPCGPGSDCSGPADCRSGVCGNDGCAPASCNDGVRNGDEGDIDCGGSCEVACGVGSNCGEPNDCETEVCAAMECQPRVCSDLPEDMPSGIYPLYFESVDSGADPTDAFCDMETDGGGWTLVLAYRHIGGTNEDLVPGDLPISPVSGFSHASPTQVAAIRDGATSARLYCSTSAHARVMHFRVDVPGVLDYLANIAPDNDVEWWRSQHTPLVGHTASLPGTADTAWENITPDRRMTEFPFFDFGSTHWGIRGSGIRWECDDFAATALNDTLHQVWIR